MGTRLVARGLDLSQDDPAVWNLVRPDDVFDLHQRDVAAGSDAVYSNTFGANRVRLARFARETEVEAIIRSAVSLAREAVGSERFVIGDIGPSAVEDARAYREHAEILMDSGVDALILETHTVAQALLGLEHLRKLDPGVPILVSLHFWPEPTRESLKQFEDLGASVIGANCVLGVENSLEVCRNLHESTNLPLLIKPSGGLPNGPAESPETFAAAVARWLTLGVRLFGGCCGTSEAHIEAMRKALA